MSSFQEDMDLALALQMQEEEQLIDETNRNKSKCTFSRPKNETKSVADGSWETIDPVPDVHALFLQFNDEYFWGKLDGIEVKWSPRMTLCAGLCSYEGRGGLCSVRLSQPLLKLRPRKDLVETLLHEMIHAYLFVTVNNKDHDAHGPEFLSHMHRINKLTGANVTVYHNFHDEVNHYHTHWWLCDGPCRHRPPFYGYVKRAMNRAPGPNDTWWSEHRATCGGTFNKIKQPDGYRRNIETESNFVPFTGHGHVLGSSTSTSTKKNNNNNNNKTIQPPILDFLKAINVTPEMNRLNKNVRSKNKTTRIAKPGFLSLSEYFRSSGSDDATARKRYSVARRKKRSAVPLYFSDSDSDCELIPEAEAVRTHSQTAEKVDNGQEMNDLSFASTSSSSLSSSSPSCPVCSRRIEEHHMNEHLDICLIQQSFDL
uniref:Protein with SprT-like domain at the N terminus n=1 Tax=Strigamia maritima TaxID=126957 RepID=T1JGT5_STRMM